MHKFESLRDFLTKGMTMVHFDGRHPDVIIPSELSNDFHVRLNFSFNFEPRDLILNETGIGATLTFPSGMYWTFVPYDAIFSISSHVTKEFQFWTESTPSEFFNSHRVNEAPQSPPTPKRPKLTLIKGGLV